MAFPAKLTIFLLACAGLSAAPPIAAEEFHLKDGTKIVGKIVGYEKNAFRVETSFGVAIIYKDRIERIVFAESAPAKSAPAPPPASAAPAKPQPEPAKKEAAAAPTPRPPEPIIEHVTGTEYINETYRFRLFKPPTWRSYPHLVKPQTLLVAALGTPDESTLLLIGRESYNGTLTDYTRLAERTLRQFYEDYRGQGERATRVAGLPAIERSFTGSAEGRFWTGVAVYFARGPQHYTLLGVTATGETTSFQQAVLQKVVDSLQFLPE